MISGRYDLIEAVTNFISRYDSLRISDEDARKMEHDLFVICRECIELGAKEQQRGLIYK